MFNPIRVAGPIFEFELLTTSRRGRYYAVRSGYACILLLIIWQIYEYWVVEFGVMMTPSLASRFALSIFILTLCAFSAQNHARSDEKVSSKKIGLERCKQ